MSQVITIKESMCTRYLYWKSVVCWSWMYMSTFINKKLQANHRNHTDSKLVHDVNNSKDHKQKTSLLKILFLWIMCLLLQHHMSKFLNHNTELWYQPQKKSIIILFITLIVSKGWSISQELLSFNYSQLIMDKQLVIYNL